MQTCQVLKNINIMREAGRGRVSKLAPTAHMLPSAKVRVFCRESFPRKFYIFHLGKRYLRHSETMKQQINLGEGKTKEDILEI